MELFESDHEFKTDDTPYQPGEEYAEITHWMQASHPILKERPLFTRIDVAIPFSMVVTLLSYLIKLDPSRWILGPETKRTSPTADIPALTEAENLAGNNAESPITKQSYLMLGFTTLQAGTSPSRVVLLPVHADYSYAHEEA